MTGPATAAPPTGQAATQPAPGTASAGAVATRARKALGLASSGGATTPRRLRISRLAVVGLALLLGVGSVVTTAQLDARQGLAEVHAAQYVRSTAIETGLLGAQAAAARASLSGASAPVAAVDAALDQVSTLVIDAAAANTDDPAALAAISHDVLRYTAALERAQLERGTSSGRSSLTDADTLLREQLLPAVRSLQANHAAVSTSQVPGWMWLLPVLAWLSVAVIVGVSWYTARISHRVVNAGLAVAAVASVVIAVSTGNLLIENGDAGAGSVGGQFTRVDQLTRAQRSSVDAFALLASGVAARSWSAADTTAYQESLDAAETALDATGDRGLSALLDTQVKNAVATLGHAKAGEWEPAAAALVPESGERPAPTAAAFRNEVERAIAAALAELRSAVRGQAAQTLGTAILAVICALFGAAAAAVGLHQRLKEYR